MNNLNIDWLEKKQVIISSSGEIAYWDFPTLWENTKHLVVNLMHRKFYSFLYLLDDVLQECSIVCMNKYKEGFIGVSNIYKFLFVCYKNFIFTYFRSHSDKLTSFSLNDDITFGNYADFGRFFESYDNYNLMDFSSLDDREKEFLKYLVLGYKQQEIFKILKCGGYVLKSIREKLTNYKPEDSCIAFSDFTEYEKILYRQRLKRGFSERYILSHKDIIAEKRKDYYICNREKILEYERKKRLDKKEKNLSSL